MFSVFFFLLLIKIRPICFLKHPRVVSYRVVYVVRAIGDGKNTANLAIDKRHVSEK